MTCRLDNQEIQKWNNKIMNLGTSGGKKQWKEQKYSQIDIPPLEFSKLHLMVKWKPYSDSHCTWSKLSRQLYYIWGKVEGYKGNYHSLMHHSNWQMLTPVDCDKLCIYNVIPRSHHFKKSIQRYTLKTAEPIQNEFL